MGETTGAAMRQHRSSGQDPSQHPSLPVPASDQAAPGELSCKLQLSAKHWACSESPGGCSAGWAIATHDVSPAISEHPFSAWRLFLSKTSSSAPMQIFVLSPVAPGGHPAQGGHSRWAAQGKAHTTFLNGMGFAQSRSTATFPMALWDAPSNGWGFAAQKEHSNPFFFLFYSSYNTLWTIIGFLIFS